MPKKKNRRKEIQAKRRAEGAAKASKPKTDRRVGIIAHPASGIGLAAMLASALRISNRSN